MRQGTISVMTSAAALVLAACGSPGVTPGPTAPAGTTKPTAPEPTATPDALEVRSISALPGAVVQIEATGQFLDPRIGEVEGSSRGSGFIISPDGIAVTNNHVVTGATTVTVWVGADRSEHSATVLGASECSDLAVIRIGGVRGSPYLSWYEGDIAPGLDIYAAGYPLGDPEFTLTRGIVSRAHGLLDETWAWVEDSIEHDANTNPGSSGGPIVTGDGRVVGVHYAGDSETEQHWAIGRDEALTVVEDLQAGRDVASIGVNGEAIPHPLHPGIWVSSVQAGSPAAEAGVQAGDIITRLGGVELAVDGTMKEYCQVLRSHGADDVLPVEVYRENDGARLRGELNGTAIVPAFSFAAALGSGSPATDDIVYDGVATDSDAIWFEAPVEWSDVQDDTWTVDGKAVGSWVLASEDATAFKDGWTTSGLFVAGSEVLAEEVSVDQWLDRVSPTFEPSCEHAGRTKFDRGGHAGSYDLWDRCGQAGSRFITAAALRENDGSLVYVQFQAAEDADLAALDRLFVTLQTDLAEL